MLQICYNLATRQISKNETNKPNGGFFMELVRFYAWVIKVAILLALIGQLKSCTLIMMGLAAEKSEKGIISYSRFTRLLTR